MKADRAMNDGIDENFQDAFTADFDAEFGERLQRHLCAELDAHVGSATDRFHASRLAPRRPGRLRIGLRWSAAAMVLLGIGVAIPIVSSQLRRPAPPMPHVAINTDAKPPIDAIVTRWSETYDGGTVFVDSETPAHLLRRVQYQKTEWKDAGGQWQSTVKPQQQDVILVDMQKQ